MNHDVIMIDHDDIMIDHDEFYILIFIKNHDDSKWLKMSSRFIMMFFYHMMIIRITNHEWSWTIMINIMIIMMIMILFMMIMMLIMMVHDWLRRIMMIMTHHDWSKNSLKVSYAFWMIFYHKIWKMYFRPNFETMYHREYFTEFCEAAASIIYGIEAPHVAKYVGKIFHVKEYQHQFWK